MVRRFGAAGEAAGWELRVRKLVRRLGGSEDMGGSCG